MAEPEHQHEAVRSARGAGASAIGERNGHSLILRWNGAAWRPMRSPDIGNLAA